MLSVLSLLEPSPPDLTKVEEKESVKSSAKTRNSSRHTMYAGRRSSMAGGNTKAATLFQPNYRLYPVRKFNKENVGKILNMTMDRYLQGFTYDPADAMEYCKLITEEIKIIIKRKNYDRMRFVCSVLIGQKKKQGAAYVARGLWDIEMDVYYNCVMDYPMWFAIGTIYAFYYD